MNNKYKDGNYLLNYSLDNLNVIFNPNYVNNSINYIFNPLYGAPINYLRFNLVSYDILSATNLRLDIYYQLTTINNNYVLYDCFNNYDEFVFVSSSSSESIYKCNHLKLYIFNNSNYSHKIEDIASGDVYYYTNATDVYPSKIELLNNDTIFFNFTNGVLSSITCNDEKIEMVYSNNKITGFNYKKIIENNDVLLFSSFITYNVDNLLYKIEYKIYEDSTYYLIKELDFSYDNLTIEITDSSDSISLTKNSLGKIEEIEYGKTISLAYYNNTVTITDDVNEYVLIYDYYNRIKYIKNDIGYKVYDYDSNSLLSYESDFIYYSSNSIISSLSNYNIVLYYDDDNEADYDFSIVGETTTIQPEIQNIIGNSTIYKIEGYGSLEFLEKKYGEIQDEILVIFYVKWISVDTYLNISFYYKSTNVSHTQSYKIIEFDVNETGFVPIIISLKPKYNYDHLFIGITVNGNIYMTSPKAIKSKIGTNYTYNANSLLSSKKDSNGIVNYYYNNNNQLIRFVKNDIETFITRNSDNNITSISTVDKDYIFYYNSSKKLRYSKINGETTTYNYDGNIIYEYKEYFTEKITKDIYGRVLQRKIFNSDYQNIYNYTYSHDVNPIQILNNNSNLSFTFDNNNNLTAASNDGSVIYQMTYDNKNRMTYCKMNGADLVSLVYNNDDYLASKTIDQLGTYSYIYNSNKKLVDVFYNSGLRYMLQYNSKKLLANNGYNYYHYDEYDNIYENSIRKIANEYLTIKCYRDGTGHRIVNETFKIRDIYKNSSHYLKDDYYYANITFNDDSDISLINSSNTYIIPSISKLYPLTASLKGIDEEEPYSIGKQTYKLFYYDNDINNYALLLYGLRVEYETTITNEFYVSLEIKLENRTINQAIIYIKSITNSVFIYRDTNQKVVIKYNNTDTNTDLEMQSDTWYRIGISLHQGSLYVDLDDEHYYALNNVCQSFGTDTTVTIGYYYLYDNMVTYGLVRNLFVYNYYLYYDVDQFYHINKSDSYDVDNNTINQEIRLNNKIVMSKDITRYIGHPYNVYEDFYATRGQITSQIAAVKYISNGVCKINDILISLSCGDGSTHSTRYNYSYDNLGRVVSEEIINVNNQNYKRSYEYNQFDNVSKINNLNDSTNYEVFVYDPFLKYKLVAYNETINNNTTSYSVSYYNYGLFIQSFMGNSYQYEGTNLIRYNNYEYNYNVNGQRINKYNTSNSVRCYYYYDLDGKLLIEERPAYKLKFLYDSNNSIYGFIKEDSLINVGFEIFYYLIDELGIIYGIMDSDGNLLGTYRYNAFGKILEIKQAYYTDNDWNGFIEHAIFILNINPIRYKSYYYDVESEMYYLNNRYYYPKLCRFLTPDRIDYIDLYNSKSYNLYSYCYNNPVCYETNHFFDDIIISSTNDCINKKITSIDFFNERSNIDFFGYEFRESSGWERTDFYAVSKIGRIGFSYYTTYYSGKKGLIYVFCGSTTDEMNWTGTTFSAGIGANNGIFGFEIELESLGIGSQISVGDLFLKLNINLISDTSISFGLNRRIDDNNVTSSGFTVGVNTGALVAAALWIYKLFTTGDPSPIPAYSSIIRRKK